MLRAHGLTFAARLLGVLSAILLAGCSLPAAEAPFVDAQVIDAEPASRIKPGPPSIAHARAGVIAISGPAVSQQPVAERLAEIAANVVTIVAGENENGGAGFYIDRGRHVLTTATAVSHTPQVMVRLANGEQVMGTVVLANRRRNVALIVTEPVDVEGLPMMIGIPDVGMPVFAPGLIPSESTNAGPAVGMITAIRRDHGLTLIESSIAGAPGVGGGPLLDAHGNVVGIAAAAAAPKMQDRQPDGSLFMPVKDALDGLGIVVERPNAPEPDTPAGREVNAGPSLDMATAAGPNGNPVTRPLALAPRFDGPLPKAEPRRAGP